MSCGEEDCRTRRAEWVRGRLNVETCKEAARARGIRRRISLPWVSACAIKNARRERWLSCLRRTPGKREYLKSTVGSNPSLSARLPNHEQPRRISRGIELDHGLAGGGGGHFCARACRQSGADSDQKRRRAILPAFPPLARANFIKSVGAGGLTATTRSNTSPHFARDATPKSIRAGARWGRGARSGQFSVVKSATVRFPPSPCLRCR